MQKKKKTKRTTVVYEEAIIQYCFWELLKYVDKWKCTYKVKLFVTTFC